MKSRQNILDIIGEFADIRLEERNSKHKKTLQVRKLKSHLHFRCCCCDNWRNIDKNYTEAYQYYCILRTKNNEEFRIYENNVKKWNYLLECRVNKDIIENVDYYSYEIENTFKKDLSNEFNLLRNNIMRELKNSKFLSRLKGLKRELYEEDRRYLTTLPCYYTCASCRIPLYTSSKYIKKYNIYLLNHPIFRRVPRNSISRWNKTKKIEDIYKIFEKEYLK